MKKLLNFLVLASLFISLVVLAPSVFAQFDINAPLNGGVPVNEGDSAASLVQTIISNAVIIVFTLAAILVLAMLIWGAVEWILSAGDKEKVASARKRITHTLVGLVILALVFVILRVVGGAVGFNPLCNLPIPSLGDAPIQFVDEDCNRVEVSDPDDGDTTTPPPPDDGGGDRAGIEQGCTVSSSNACEEGLSCLGGGGDPDHGTCQKICIDNSECLDFAPYTECQQRGRLKLCQRP